MKKLEFELPEELSEYKGDLQMFVQAMVDKLTCNAHKGKWEDVGLMDVLKMMDGEFKELMDALEDDDVDAAFWELVDVGNFALIAAMVALRGPNPFKPSVTRGTPLAFLKWAAEQNTDGCILWPFKTRTGPKQEYGSLSKGQHPAGKRAHRVVCHMVHGGPPTTEHHASHLCGNPLCVNPRHLAWETPVENAARKREHGTWHQCNKLNWEIARKIRKGYSLGVKVIDMAEELNVSIQSVYKVINNHTYVEEQPK